MKENSNSYDYDVIIIGAGMGGLAAGNILLQKGYNVLIIEKHTIPGGFCTNFSRKDYTFDCSLHMLNGCEEGGMIYNVLKRFGAENCIEFIKLNELFHWKSPKGNIDLVVSPKINDFIKQLINLFPPEEKNIKKFYKRYLKVYKFMMLWASKGLMGKIFTLFHYFISFIRFLKILNTTVSEILNPYISDPICRNLITILGGFFGLGPDKLSACIFLAGLFSYYVEGAYYPKGGSGAFSQALADIFVRNGGKLLLSTEVIRVNFSEKLCSGITVSNIKENTNSYTSRVIIANSDVTELITKLCPLNCIPKDYYKNVVSRRPGFSAICVYLGINLDLNEMGFKDYELWVSNTIKNQTTEDLRELARTLRFLEFPTTAITIYSNIDSTCCPKGKSVISSVFYALPEPFLKSIEKDGGKRGHNYKELKAKIGKKFVKNVSEILEIPNLNNHIEVIEVATPITLKRYTNNRNGSFMGWEMTPDQMLLNQLPQKTPIPNLFLVGAWAMPSGGVSTVLYSGDTCSRMVDKYLRKNK